MYELKLTKEQTILLNLVAQSIHENPASIALSNSEIDGADWEEIRQESIAQAVPLAVFDATAIYKKFIPKDMIVKESSNI